MADLKHRFLIETISGFVPFSGGFSVSPSDRAQKNSKQAVSLPKINEFQVPRESLEDSIARRSSRREYIPEKLNLQDISFLSWSCQGIRKNNNRGDFRNVPSAGACHPFHMLIAALRVEGLEPLLYYYNPFNHALYPYGNISHLGRALTDACLGQSFIGDAGAVFIWIAEMEIALSRYGARGYRYLFLDAGHIGQNLYLAAENLGLGTCAIGAFDDHELNKLLELNESLFWTLYVASVGKHTYV